MTWGQIFSQTYEQESAPDSGKFPLPPAYWPPSESLNYSYLVVGATSATAKATWDLAAHIYFRHTILPGVTLQSERQAVLLNQDYTLIQVPHWMPTYSLRIEFPYWLESLNLTMFAETFP